MNTQFQTPGLPVRVGSHDGAPVEEVLLRAPGGAEARILTFGATIRDLTLPGRPAGPQGVVLGFDSFDRYPDHRLYFGALAGRFANRIRGARFRLDGQDHLLDANEAGRTTLHGGGHGFGQCNWSVTDADPASVTLSLRSPDGDQGFPGTLDATCRYALSQGSGTAFSLTVELTATTDRATPVNITQHSYFALDDAPDMRHHDLQVHADHYLPTAADQCPDGSITPVSGTAFDLRRPRPLAGCGPLDTPFVLSGPPRPDGLVPAARLSSRLSGRVLDVATTKPGLQVYDGSYIPAGLAGLRGRTYGPKSGLCLETQFHPDSPNQPGFPDTILRPGQTYRHRTVFTFSQGDPTELPRASP